MGLLHLIMGNKVMCTKILSRRKFLKLLLYSTLVAGCKGQNTQSSPTQTIEQSPTLHPTQTVTTVPTLINTLEPTLSVTEAITTPSPIVELITNSTITLALREDGKVPKRNRR